MPTTRSIESLLFIASRPLTVKRIADHLHISLEEATKGIEELKSVYNTEHRGVQLAQHGTSVQLVTHPLSARLVADFLKEERSGELTRPSVETLTIVAYRGPIPKAEIDLIRGVNCSLILRNLMVRGLVTAREDKDAMATLYEISFDFLRHLGLRSVSELPDYEQLKGDERLERLLRPNETPAADNGGEADGPSSTEGAKDAPESKDEQDETDEEDEDA